MASGNSAKDNQIAGYVRPYMKNLVEADAKVNDKTTSKIVNKALEEYYGKMSPQEQQQLIARSKNIY